jgi:hypothetical protein
MKTLPCILALIVLAVGLIAVACGGSGDGDGSSEGPDIFPAPGNSELVVGPNRFAFALNDEDGTPLLEKDVQIQLFYGEELKSEQPAGFTWAIPDSVGFYVVNVDFDQAGQWTAEVALTQDDGSESMVTFTFPVVEDSAFPNIGDPAPASDSPTLATEPNILKLSTDDDPDLSFYQTSIADALTEGKPAVIVFATPAFCTTQFCGPVLDNVKEVSTQYVDQVTFIHVEPYELDDEGTLVSAEGGGPTPTATVAEWGLPTEPWVYVIDAGGVVSKRFEGSAGPDELTAAIEEAIS